MTRPPHGFEQDIPEKSSATLILWLWRDYLRRHLGLVLIAVLFMSIEGSMLGLLSYLIKPMFDRVLVAGQSDAVLWVALSVFGVFTLRALASFGQRVIMAHISQKVAASLQGSLVAHMLTLDGKFFQDNSPGTLIERTRGDSSAAATVWGTVLSVVARDAISLVSLLAVAVSVDWRWTLVAVAGAPLLAVPLVLLQNLVRRTTRVARSASARVSTRLDEIFHGATTIKLAGTEKREAGRFRSEMADMLHAQIKAAAGQAAIPALIDIVAGLGFFGVLLYGGHQIIEGTKTVGEFMSFFTAMALVFEPLRRLGNVSGIWQAARASLDRIYAIFAERPQITTPAKPVPLPVPPSQADIRFEAVDFAYADSPVLRGTNFTAEAGKTTALVGASGAGKSTVFNLMTRLADPVKGKITIGGVATTALDLAGLRGLYSVVSQDALLFDESLRDNILMGAEADEATLQAALKAAHVADFAGQLDHGLDTPVGPRGSGLSGGQRQRVAIARAVLRNRPILLLDEATSALDAQSEKIVQEALETLSEGRTTLVIAHRLSTIKNADKIVVMDKGRVVDEGTHEELLARGGLYADLYRLQYSDGRTVTDGGRRGKATAGPRRDGTAEDAEGSALLAATSRAVGSVLGLFGRTRR
ncbi:ABC transporter ATP-binding protein [Celeribacter indicus]|uniref:Efflux ABC transporter transmembrane ATP-binding protein n=1 Tax=Celeribacter indicus TaxID=1208324 RepID=A0A0B5DSF8_9RHOB|nr:efflux ABC transporter transmembrane ATP-binding protein [Celeribacter indicus]SDW65474.1 ABC-type multidrug transport system, ATPase and permease component [Celeribacter indicus]